MIRADVIRLISDNPEAHGVYEDDIEEIGREVLCTVRSASYRDIEAAGSQGMRPEIVFRLAYVFEYQGETACEYRGTRYNIDRVYFNDTEDWIDLTCSRGDPGV